ncbi:MAG TPA: sialidase family protein [Acidimicrobiales bacterium]|nr:sialidase family protein [Acidimicrobiales bacterium]
MTVSLSLALFQGKPAVSASLASTTVPSRLSLTLEAIDFSSPSSGLGVFTEEPPRSLTCKDFVGKSTNGGANFNSLSHAMSWNCASASFSSSLTADGHGDVFLYGPRLYVSHDDAKTWIRDPQSESVWDVDAVGLSVWMIESKCALAVVVGRSSCPIRLLESTNGGRTWSQSLNVPQGSATGISSGAQGQSYLDRINRSTAYLMFEPHSNAGGGPSVAPLWYTSNGGRTWSNRQVPCHIGALSSVFSVASNGTLIAACASQPSAGSQIKSVLESSDGGRTWTLKTDGAINFGYLGAIDLVSSKEAFLVGGRSSLLVTHDGGTRWRAVQPLIGSTAGGTSEVIFFDTSHGLVIGNNDRDNERLTLWSTTDGGRHWTVVLPVTN